MERVELLLSHVWMVRTFLKHAEESAEDEDLQQVHRDLYDVMLAVGEAYREGNADRYMRQIKKKRAKLQSATKLFVEIQPEISTHTNFAMAANSLQAAVAEIVMLS